MRGLARLIVLLAASICTVSGCSGSAAVGQSQWDVAGRHLQPPWWEAMPVPPSPSARDNTMSVPAKGFVIPSDTLFEVGSATVRPQDIDKLQAFGSQLVPYLSATKGPWTIAGGTDSTGSPESNDTLGRSRASAVRDVLLTVTGMESSRFHVESWGETRPEVDEATAPDPTEARARNRRVVIIPPETTPILPPSTARPPTKGPSR